MIKKGDTCLLPHACYSIEEMKEYGECKEASAPTHFHFTPDKDMEIKTLDDLSRPAHK